MWAIEALTDNPSADSIVALVTAGVGVFGIHIGHMTGHQQEARRTDRERILAVLEQTQPQAVEDARTKLGLRWGGMAGAVGSDAPTHFL